MIYIKEYLLSQDEFNKPKVIEGKDAIFNLLVKLLLLEPGTVCMTHPEMGIGIVSRYRYSYSENLSELQKDCVNQISTYLPELIGVSVDLSMSADQELNIKITVDGILYLFKTDTKNNNVISLSSL